MVMYGYQWLSMVMYGYHWLSMVMYGYQWLSMVMYGYHWLYMVMYGIIGYVISSKMVMREFITFIIFSDTYTCSYVK